MVNNAAVTKGRKELLEGWLQDLVDELQQEIIRRGHETTGKTRRGIVKRNVTAFGGEIVAPLHFLTLEHGSKPWKKQSKHPPKWFIGIIDEWLQKKGLPHSPYHVAKKIMTEGSRIFRRGGNTGIITDVITEKKVDDLLLGIARYERSQYIIGVNKTINKMKDNA